MYVKMLMMSSIITYLEYWLCEENNVDLEYWLCEENYVDLGKEKMSDI